MNKKILDRKNLNRGIIIAGIVVAIALSVLIWLLNRAFLTVNVSPKTAVVTVDNRPISINQDGLGKITLSPGPYTLKVEENGYITEIKDVSLGRASTEKVAFSLEEKPEPYSFGKNAEQPQKIRFISNADDFNSIFYLAENPFSLYRAKFKEEDGEIETTYNSQISNPDLKEIEDIVWSPKKDSAIFQRKGGTYLFDFQKYNFVAQEEKLIGTDIGDLAWSPDNSKIAYYYAPNNGERTLIFSDLLNKNPVRVANLKELNIENPYLSWSPDSEWLIVIPRNKDMSQNQIYLFNAYTRTFTTVNDSGNNVAAKFTPDGQKIIYSTYQKTPDNPVATSLSIMNKDGSEKRSLGLKARINKLDFLDDAGKEIVVATFAKEKNVEAIFSYDTERKEKAGFVIPLEKGSYVDDILVSAEKNFIYYLIDGKFYIENLKR